ncbi:nucleotide pyrophosphohydrolase [Desulfosporosinus fructosivorans]|uniref:Nucleotide pyrophosphohydrolase n=2 Tax=Desulfosporosinus fructosivorans TaxID=2018669 RepID=A0A4Z0R8C0_9FIRM|nr:nucleotide pyrophosphohydrolase [Desulfosporosinus fructosivorans]
MTIEEIIIQQQEFDSNYKGKFNWNQIIDNEHLEILEFLLLSMVGEFGEATNIVKKVIRGDKTLEEVKDDLSEEIIDIFIYVIKLIYQLDIDLDKVYSAKMEKNKIRFKEYESDKI